MGWPIARRGPGGNAFYVETEFDHGFGDEIPIKIVCDRCGAWRALSTITAVAVAFEGSDSIWIQQSEAFMNHRCITAPEGRGEFI